MGQFFSVEFDPQYITFKVFYRMFPVVLSMNEHSTDINKKKKMKIYQILGILQGF